MLLIYHLQSSVSRTQEERLCELSPSQNRRIKLWLCCSRGSVDFPVVVLPPVMSNRVVVASQKVQEGHVTVLVTERTAESAQIHARTHVHARAHVHSHKDPRNVSQIWSAAQIQLKTTTQLSEERFQGKR